MSSHMSGRLDLTPADLDRLEDALEDLELSSASDEPSADDLVAQRLTEYRELMVLARDAMPLEDVPAGLLDGVIAEARQAAAMAPAAAAPSFWSRWRLSVWVPALAFAGSAALLLVMLVPTRNEAPSAEVAAAAPDDARKAEAKADAKADGRLALAEPMRQEEGSLAEDEVRAGGVVIGERAPEPAAAAQPSGDGEEQAEAPSDDAAASQRQKAASGGKGTSLPGALAEPKPAPKAPPSAGTSAKGKKEPLPDPLGGSDTGKRDENDAQQEKKTGDSWSEISRADADRRSGSCGLAKMRYDKLRKLDDPRVRARALAGAGLCAAASDDPSTAKKLFEQARAADPGVSGFIDDELARLEGARTNASDPAPRAGDAL